MKTFNEYLDNDNNFENDWDLFLELCDEAVSSAKDWLKVEENLAALDEYYSSQGL